MTIEQWQEIGEMADREYVDFGRKGNHGYAGWAKKVKKLGYISEEDVQEVFGGWEGLFWEAVEWA